MKVKVCAISSAGANFHKELMPCDLDLCEDFLDAEKPIIVTGFLERIDGFLLAKLDVSYTADTICSRCLDPIEGVVSFPLSLEIEIKSGDEFVDLGLPVREEILIRYAPTILCKVECKGICSQCGAYLNTEKCECQKDK